MPLSSIQDSQNPIHSECDTYRDYAAACLKQLQQRWYDEDTGLWKNAGWWNSANILEAVIDYASLTQTDSYDEMIQNAFEKTKQVKDEQDRINFLRNHYDDQLWFCLTWIKASDFTRNRTQKEYYLKMAEAIFEDTTHAWSDHECGGGVWWQRIHEKSYKNAITNELFLMAAARLYLRTRNDDFLYKWALPTWRWFQTSGLLSKQELIYDHLDHNCVVGGDGATTTWTYNQGVILGGLADMYRITKDVVYLAKAQNIAHAALVFLVDERGILKEPVERPFDDADAPQFKGIFMRNLAYFAQTLTLAYGLTSSTAEPYKQFIRCNVAALWKNRRIPHNEFGYKWDELSEKDEANAMKQGSALDAFNAALLVLS